MIIDVSKLDLYRNFDFLHVTIEDKTKISKLTEDLIKTFPQLQNKLIVTTNGITMSKFTKDEIKQVIVDLKKLIGEESKVEIKAQVTKEIKKETSTKEKCFRVKNLRTNAYVSSSNGKSIWLRKPSLSSMYLSEKDHKIVTFEMFEV